jgi:hypothetical protein
MDIAKLCIPMLVGAGSSPSLSKGMSVPKLVGPPWWRRFESLGVAYHLRVDKGKGPSAQT